MSLGHSPLSSAALSSQAGTAAGQIFTKSLAALSTAHALLSKLPNKLILASAHSTSSMRRKVAHLIVAMCHLSPSLSRGAQLIILAPIKATSSLLARITRQINKLLFAR